MNTIRMPRWGAAQRRFASVVLTALFLATTLAPAAQVVTSEAGLSTIESALAACDDGAGVSGGGVSGSLACNTVDQSGKGHKGSSGAPINCTIGQRPWALPRNLDDTGSVKTDESILTETWGTYNDYFTAAYDMASPYFTTASGKVSYDNGQNSQSWFWALAFPDMVAMALQIEPSSAKSSNGWTGTEGGSTVLHLRSPSARSTIINARVTSGSKLVVGDLLTIPSYYGSRYLAPEPGKNTISLLDKPLAISGTSFPSPAVALASLKTKLRERSGDAAYDFTDHLYRDDRKLSGAPAVVKDAASQGYLTDNEWGRLPVYIQVVNSAGTPLAGPSATKVSGLGFVWTVGDLGTPIPAGSSWQAYAVFQSYDPVYTTLQNVAEGLRSVIDNNLAQKWNSPSNVRGNSATGTTWYPAFAFSTRGRNPEPDCGAYPDLKFFTVELGHQTKNSSCNTPAVKSDASYYSQIGNPHTCYLHWASQKIPPPSITATAWKDAKSRILGPVELAPTTPGALVNQPVTIKPDDSILSPTGVLTVGKGTDFSLSNPFGVTPAMSATFQMTQVGISLELGTQTLAVIPRDFQRADGGYTKKIAFTRTPQSRLQDSYCASATSAANLMDRCGIGFRLDNYGQLQPYYHVTVRTWWDGIYRFTADGTTYYCGIFSAQCSNIPSGEMKYISDWQASWGFDTRIHMKDGTVSSWPNPPAQYGTGYPWAARGGSPMYDTSFGNVGFDISVAQVQVQGQDGNNIVPPPIPGPVPTATIVPTPTPSPTPKPTATPTPKPTPTPPTTVKKTVQSCLTVNANIRKSPSTSAAVVRTVGAGATVYVYPSKVSGSSWGPYSCGSPSSGNSWWHVYKVGSTLVDGYIYAGALK